MIKYQVIKKTLATSDLILDQMYSEEELSMMHKLNINKIKYLESIKVLKVVSDESSEEEDQKKKRGRPKK